MPVCTYFNAPLPTPEGTDPEIVEMLDELGQATKATWFIQVIKWEERPFPYFKTIEKERVYLYKSIGDSGEYQVLTCVHDMSHLWTYLYGALGVVDYNKRKENERQN